MSFADTGLSEHVLKAVTDSGYDTPTPIQEKAIPTVLMGRDILGCAQTGTGKTASFTLPMIDILSHGRAKMRMPRSLILEPTRELATQVAENFDKYGKYSKLNKALLIGGTDMKAQIKILDAGADVLIATPGRLLDMFERGHLIMRDVKILVIDEADRMLDMGFIPDIEKIVAMLPPLRQTLFFSATMAPEIKRLADKFLLNPKEISVSAPASAAATVTQGLAIVRPTSEHRGMDGKKKLKRDVLREMIDHEAVSDAIVFCNRKIDVAAVYKSLHKRGYSVGQLHGDMSQPARTEMLAGFKNKDFNILVCSDVAARGLDVPNLSHVFNYDIPINAEDYVHRIGRTGRAGKEGHAYSIALPEDGKFVAAIERLVGKEIPRLSMDGFAAAELSEDDGRGGRGGRSGGRGSERGGERGGRGGRDRKPAPNKDAGSPASVQASAPAQAASEAAPVQAVPVQQAQQPAAQPAEQPTEQAAKVDDKPAESPQREARPERKERGGRGRGGRNGQDRNGQDRGGRERGGRDRGGRDRSPVREIHNEICDGHMPAFLMRAPDTLVSKDEAPAAKDEKKAEPKKAAPKKRAPRKKAAPKTDAPSASESGTSED